MAIEELVYDHEENRLRMLEARGVEVVWKLRTDSMFLSQEVEEKSEGGFLVLWESNAACLRYVVVPVYLVFSL